MAATRADVARRAGVSPSTVTYVLTGQRSTSQATRERVRQAIEELGYQPNLLASFLASRSVRSVGVLLRMERESVEVGDLLYIDGVRAGVEGAGIQVVVPMGLRSRPQDNLHDLIRSRSIDSAILMDVAIDDEREAFLLQEGVPTVLIGTSGRPGGVPSIDADFDQMAELAMRHLAALGHERVLMVTRSPDIETARTYQVQHEAVRSVAARVGLTGVYRALPDNVIFGGQLVGPTGLVEGCTAVLSNNPAVLSGILAAAQALGLEVPRDLSAMSMGSLVSGGTGQLLASASDVDAYEMGRSAGDMLVRLIKEPGLDEHVSMPATLIDRGPQGRRREDKGGYERRKPPSVAMTCPVTQAASSVSSQVMSRAGSTGSGIRPPGKRGVSAAMSSGLM